MRDGGWHLIGLVVSAMLSVASARADSFVVLPRLTAPGEPSALPRDCVGPHQIAVSLATGQSACLSYEASVAGGNGPVAIVQLAPVLPQRATDPAPAGPGSVPLDAWSRLAHAPVAILARIKDEHAGDLDAKAGSKRDVEFAAVALDRLKSRLGVSRIALVGLGALGNLAATLHLTRDDVGCTVMAGAWLSERDRLAETGETFSPAVLRARNDPLAVISRLPPRAPQDAHQPGLVDVVDPADPNTPEAAIAAFADAARAKNVAFSVIALPALTPTADRLQRAMIEAIHCATGQSVADLREALQPPTAIATAPRPPASDPKAPAPKTSDQKTPAPVPPSSPILLQSLETQIQSRERTEHAAQTLQPPPQSTVEPPALMPILPQESAAPLAVLRQSSGLTPYSDPTTFTRGELLAGKSIDAASCAHIPEAVWVTSVGAPDCIRSYYSDVGGKGTRALVFLNGDFTYRGLDGQPTADPDYAHLAPDDLQHVADVRSRDYGGPMIYLARPGTLGSSGNEMQVRHSPREVALVTAALDALKRRHDVTTFDILGHSGGGLLVGALVAERRDIGCAVSSSGVLATNAWTSQRLNLPPSNSGFLYDPIDHIDDIRPGPNFRYILLTDAADATVSAASTQLYLDALAAAHIPYLHITLTASDAAHHDLALAGFRAAIGCAHGLSDAEIRALLTKPPRDRATPPDALPFNAAPALRSTELADRPPTHP